MAGSAGKRYPLAAARSLREQELEAAKSELGRTSQALSDAEASVTRAEHALVRHGQDTHEIAARESDADARGRSVSDMLAGQAYLERRRREEAMLRAQLDRARQMALEAAQAVEHARAALSDARAAREAVEKHHARWLAGIEKEDERRTEAELDDLSLTRRR